MNQITLIVEKDDAGKRLDSYIAENSDDLSRSAVEQLCKNGSILINGIKAQKNTRLKGGEKIDYVIPDASEIDAVPEDIPLAIVFEDEHLVVVNKPQGMVVHPAPGNYSKTLVNALLFHCSGKLSSINGMIRPGIVHRIDKDTSGLLVVAKDNATHEGLSRQFSEHTIKRIYFAVVHGNIADDSGRIEGPIGRHPTDRKKMCITEKNSKYAATNYSVIERYGKHTFLKLQLETGRTHQIRVHMASLGHPVAGDAVYSKHKQQGGLIGQCLHAGILGFVHPITGEELLFESNLPDYFEDFLKYIKKQ